MVAERSSFRSDRGMEKIPLPVQFAVLGAVVVFVNLRDPLIAVGFGVLTYFVLTVMGMNRRGKDDP